MFLIASSALGQTIIRGTTSITSEGVVSDTINHSPNRDFEKRINLGPIDSSSFDFEIRFYKLTAATNKRNLRIVRLTNEKWDALEFYENRKSKIKERLIFPIAGFNTFVENLIRNNFHTLPNQTQIEKRIEKSYASKYEYLSSQGYTMDGYGFTVEFKINDRFRIYQFANPESHSRYFDNYEELRNYVAIQKMFEEDLVRK